MAEIFDARKIFGSAGDDMRTEADKRLAVPIDSMRVLIWGSFAAGIVVSWLAIGWGVLKLLA